MEPNKQNKEMSKIEQESGNKELVWQGLKGRGEGNKGGKMGKGLVKEQV